MNMKMTGYTRLTDQQLARDVRAYIRDRGKPASIFTQGDPLCWVDKRRCRDRGKIQSGQCRCPTSVLFKLGPCRKVEVIYHDVSIKEL